VQAIWKRTFKGLKYSGLLVMCKNGGMKGRALLKLGIMIAKESGKREAKDTCWRISDHVHCEVKLTPRVSKELY
jgi:hypothetical protein